MNTSRTTHERCSCVVVSTMEAFSIEPDSIRSNNKIVLKVFMMLLKTPMHQQHFHGAMESLEDFHSVAKMIAPSS